MTQDEIIEMYLQVSKELCNDTEWCWAGVVLDVIGDNQCECRCSEVVRGQA